MRLVILTGAGISADSGVDTFRDEGGVWSQVRLEDVATPEAFLHTPDRVHAFYNRRRAQLPNVAPNAAHLALAALERRLREDRHEFVLITQNVDNLHQRAGSDSVFPMHGQLDRALCVHCGGVVALTEDLSTKTACPQCQRQGGMRPNIVWFGEIPHFLDDIAAAIEGADHFVAIGTSGTVYPAAGLVEGARQAGAVTTLINRDPAENDTMFDHIIAGRAAEAVPAWADRLVDSLTERKA
ncbi:NAD-dependent deacetylase [Parvularcula bermudensis HTCC2503]|uniref:NAD-dependent protein deacylase n=1 Tax=Parvularcula bermudensis (strain ATCC BAA-594 / HTCC2503 / KCTC 12087) TaxID=314260 RepID=E0TE48_PARBH|nr:NAD-dependent deacylase [Parvularcula bermudensis]ADM08869.1 NAD-dependent deacetylase [Parvularcula bermudensis HTCC2503]